MELVKVNHAIAVAVNFSDDLLPDAVIRVDVMAEDRSDLSGLDGTTAISVEESEGCAHVLLVEQLVLVNSGCAPLRKVDSATRVGVSLHKDRLGTFVDCSRILIREELTVALDELILLDQAITIFIPLLEGLFEFVLLSLSSEMTSHEGQRRLLKLGLVLFNSNKI